MTDDSSPQWIDALSEPAVTLAAHVWKKDLPETWGILSRAIQNEELSNPIPLSEFQEYIQLHQPQRPMPVTLPVPFHVEIDEAWIASLKSKIKPARPITGGLEEHNIYKDALERSAEHQRLHPPQTLEKRNKKFFDNIAWQPIVIGLCLLAFIVGQFSTEEPINPTPTFNSTAWMSTVIVMRTEQACLDDSMAGVPYKYSRCNPNPLTEPPDDYFSEEEPHFTPTCLIKGNISFDTGEKIYHLPGQKFYDSTTIDHSYGERWFCTEAEAQAAGFRKSLQ